VAIIQVSRITQRKGLQQDLPQPLAGAELGWAIDQRRLFIGNGTLADGAPAVGNTEILTEFSDVLAFTTAYTYKGDAAGYTVQTGTSSGTPVSTSLQLRLDDTVSVKAFGATGDGVTDDTAAINRALYQLYCVQINPQIRRGLYFPAGRYVISDTLLIPPYALLYGEGANSSQIYFSALEWISNTAYANNTLVKDSSVSPTDYYRALQAVPATGISLTDTSYWSPVTLAQYVARTTDSLQQTGANIGLGGATAPTHIQLQNLCLQTTEKKTAGGHDIFLLDRCNEVSVGHCDFIGSQTSADLTGVTYDQACVRVTATSALPATMIDFDQCRFTGTTYALNTDNATRGFNVRSSLFDQLYQGLVLGDSSPTDGGPVGFRIMHNTFDNIYAQGIVIDSVSFNLSAYNMFLDVGNEFGLNPASAVIEITDDNNLSVGDLFQRTEVDVQTYGYPQVKLWNTSTSAVPVSVALSNGQTLTLGSYTRHSGLQDTLTNNATNTTLFSIDLTAAAAGRDVGGFSTFRMEYNITRPTAVSTGKRRGTFTVVAIGDNDSSGNAVTYDDDYTENEVVDVDLTAVNTAGVLTVSYTAGDTGYDGTIYYSLSYLD
jgi:hypothetical protein